jgi:1,3-beta-glucanosyltransferase GAS1
MAFVKLLATAGLLASLAIAVVNSTSVPTISTSGSKFYDSNGNQFFIKGLGPRHVNCLNILTM